MVGKGMESRKGSLSFWACVAVGIAIRLLLIWFPLNLDSRPEIATPLTSLSRLAEGQWLKQMSLSPYEGSMYHGSPLLLSILGPLTVRRITGQPNQFLISLVFVLSDFIVAILIRATGNKLRDAYVEHSGSSAPEKAQENKGDVNAADVACVMYLLNPMTIVTCVGSSTSPIENLMVVLCLYGACAGSVPLAAFGWVMATHLSLYPFILIVPVVLLLGCGPDSPPKKVLKFTSLDFQRASQEDKLGPGKNIQNEEKLQNSQLRIFSWKRALQFILWSFLWWLNVLFLCSISLGHPTGLKEMLKKTYGFILTVEDLSPNLGILWYFFAEVFDFFRVFFLLVFHGNILFMMLPLAIRLNHRPCFLACVYITIYSMLKSYPSVSDSALYLGLMCLFVNELAAMRFSFFLFGGYVGVNLLSSVMHNLWIWRNTGNANFYFATGLAYACFQTIFIVESVGTMLNHDRKLKKQMLLKREL